MHLNNIIPAIKSHSCQNYCPCVFFTEYSNQSLVTVTVTSAVFIHFTALPNHSVTLTLQIFQTTAARWIHKITFLEALNTLKIFFTFPNHIVWELNTSVAGFSEEKSTNTVYDLCSSGRQSGHPSAGTADRRGSMDQGKHQLSSDKETQWEDSTHSNTWVESADKCKQAQRHR